MNTQKGFSTLLGLSLFIVLVGSSLYLYIEKTTKGIPEVEFSPVTIEEMKVDNTTKEKLILNEKVSYSIQKNTIYVMVGNEVVDMLAVSEDAEAGMTMIEDQVDELLEDKRFIISQDVNYDGQMDVAVLTGIGYGGVNYFYDYYLYNPQIRKLQKYEVLSNVGNPIFDSENKRIVSTYRSGPNWFEVRFQWNSDTYLEVQASPGPEEGN